MSKPWCIWKFFEKAVTRSKLPGAHQVSSVSTQRLQHTHLALLAMPFICYVCAQKVALADDEGSEVTFEELQTMAEEIDVWMRQLGAGPGTKVMLVNSISIWAMAAVLAVLRNGSIIIPNDHKDPAEYRAELIAMADVKLVLCEQPDMAFLLASSASAERPVFHRQRTPSLESRCVQARCVALYC